MKMSIKKIPAKSVLSSIHQVTIGEVSATAERVVGALCYDAGMCGLEQGGPLEFIYSGYDGNPATAFSLEIALPIKRRTKYEGTFHLDRKKPIKCASLEYAGPMTTINRGYEALYNQLSAKGLKPTGEVREVYVHWVGYYSPQNVTELQVAVK